MARAPQKQERGFRYQKRDKDSLKERANMKGGNYDTYIKPKFKQWKPKDGKNIIRVLPPTWDDARHYGLDIFVNFNIGPDNQSYLSLSKHDRGPDPLAEARREAMNDGDKDFAKKLNPSQRILYWIIDRNDEDEGPLLWAAPFTFDKSLSNLCIDEDTKEVIFIDDPAKGRDVRFYREGQGLKTTYDPSKMKVLKESNVHEDETIEQEWLDFIAENPLPEVLNFYDYDHIKASFGGAAGREDDDDDKPRRGKRPEADDEDEKPARGKRRVADADEEDEKPARGKRKEADDEEDEKPARSRQRAKSGDDDDAEDEDEKPQRRSASRKQAAEPDDDADEEDEKPARGKRRVADEDDEPAPKTRGPRRDQEADDEEDEKPARRSRSRSEDEDEDPPSTRRTKKSSDDDEEGGGTLREKLAARRRSRNSDDD